MTYGDEINDFALNAYPDIFAEIASDTLNILRAGKTSDGAGGFVESAETAVNDTPIPCSVQAVKRNSLDARGEQTASVTEYKIIFPAMHAGSAVDIKTTDRLKVTRDDRIFSIYSLERHQGMFIKAICKLEN